MIVLGTDESVEAATKTSAESTVKPRGVSLSIMAVLAVVVVGGTVFHTWLHHRIHGVYNPTQIGLAFFLVINILITWWEIALFLCQDQVRAQFYLINQDVSKV